jgi:hypothetical protein
MLKLLYSFSSVWNAFNDQRSVFNDQRFNDWRLSHPVP